MSASIYHHSLDCDLAFELSAHMRNVGVRDCYDVTIETLVDHLNYQTEFAIVILRPEFLNACPPVTLNRITGLAKIVIPVLRIPIEIEHWHDHLPLNPIFDFSNDGYDTAIQAFDNLISTQADIINTPSSCEIYRNQLFSYSRKLIHTISLLEHCNYHSPYELETPLDYLLEQTEFTVKQAKAGTKRTESLAELCQQYPSFTLINGNYDESVMISYLVKTIITSQPPTQLPLIIDVETCKHPAYWDDWLSDQYRVVNTLSEEDITVIIIGIERTQNSLIVQRLDNWLQSPQAPERAICIYSTDNLILHSSRTTPIVLPKPLSWPQYLKLIRQFPTRPLSQIILKSPDQIPLPQRNFLIRQPILSSMLLSLQAIPQANETSHDLIRPIDLIQCVLGELKALYSKRFHKLLPSNYVNELIKLSSDLRTTNDSHSLAFWSSELCSEYSSYIGAGVLVETLSGLQFSLNAIDSYFRGLVIIQDGAIPQIPQLSLNTNLRRNTSKFDDALIAATLLTLNRVQLLEDISKLDPLLALICITNGATVTDTYYKTLIDANLAALSTVGDFRLDLALTISKLVPQTGMAILLETMRNAHWQIRQEATLNFASMDVAPLPGLTDAISHLTNPLKQSISTAILRLGSDSMHTLLTLIQHDDVNIRINAAWGLGELGDHASVPALTLLLNDTQVTVKLQAIRSIAKLGDVSVIPQLLSHLQTARGSVQDALRVALLDFYTTNKDEFINVYSNLDRLSKTLLQKHLRPLIADQIAELSSFPAVEQNIEAAPMLVANAENRNPVDNKPKETLEDCISDMSIAHNIKVTVGNIVARVLTIMLHNKQNVETQKQNNNSSQVVKARLMSERNATPNSTDIRVVSETDTTTLGTTKDQTGEIVTENISSIIKEIRNGKWTDTAISASELRNYLRTTGNNVSSQEIQCVIELLQDDNWVIRWIAIDSLGWSSNFKVIPHLVKSLDDKNWKIKVAAIRAIAEIRAETAIPNLSLLINDPSSVVREATAEALGIIGGQQALKPLALAALDQEEFVRLAAMEALGKLRQTSATQSLLVGLKDKSEHVRWAAANGLVPIADTSLVEAIKPSLEDASGPYWEQKRICDVIADIIKRIDSVEAEKTIADWQARHN